MNVNVIRKCLDELAKAEPRLDYVQGMLETLIELNETVPTTTMAPLPLSPIVTTGLHSDSSTSRISTGPIGGL